MTIIWKPIFPDDPLLGPLSKYVRPISFDEFQLQYQYKSIIHQSRKTTVRLAKHMETNQDVVIKTIYKSKLSEARQVNALIREIKILRELNGNKHTTQLYDVLDVIEGIYLILEYAEGGDLLTYIKSRKALHEF